MNSNGLARLYDTLTPWERLPLIVAASARADEREQDRLARSAPKNSFRVPDYWGLAEGLDHLVKLYLLKQLDWASLYWRCLAFGDTQRLLRNRRREKRLGQAMKMLAYRYVIRAEGWKLLRAELHVDANFLASQLPGYEIVQHMEQVARLIAFTAEEAVAYLRETDEPNHPAADGTPALPRVYRIESAAEVAQAMRQYLSERLDDWS